MRIWMTTLLAFLVLLGFPGTSTADEVGAAQADAAEAAYRAGDYRSAQAHWAEMLEGITSHEGRGITLYNMGNAAYRDGRYIEAVARYSAAIEESPRESDYWANLELARSAAGLEAADRGDLAATMERLYTMLRIPELEFLSYALLGLLGLCLLVEAMRGGRLARFLSIAIAILVVCVFGLRTLRVETGLEGRVMVTADVSAAVRSEPNVDLPIILQLEPGTIAERRDELPGWLRIESKGTTGWIEERHVLSIDAPESLTSE